MSMCRLPILMNPTAGASTCRAHVEGKLKAEIIQDPERYVSRDPEMAQTLLDQRQAGKALLLITNRCAWLVGVRSVLHSTNARACNKHAVHGAQWLLR